MVGEKQIEAIIAANYENCLETLAQISKVQSNGEPMLKYSTRFHNYDKIGESLYRKNKPKTPDMIFVLNDTLFLVEFKSGMYTYTKEYFENWLNDHGLINHEEKCES